MDTAMEEAQVVAMEEAMATTLPTTMPVELVDPIGGRIKQLHTPDRHQMFFTITRKVSRQKKSETRKQNLQFNSETLQKLKKSQNQ